jgi:hypothetical protein
MCFWSQEILRSSVNELCNFDIDLGYLNATGSLGLKLVLSIQALCNSFSDMLKLKPGINVVYPS